MKKHAKFYAALISLFFLLSTSCGFAATLTFSVSGKIDVVDERLSSYFSPGDLISGHIELQPPTLCPLSGGGLNFPCESKKNIQEIDLKVGQYHFYSDQPAKNGVLILRDASLSILFAQPISDIHLKDGVTLNNLSMGLDDYDGPAINRTDFMNNQPDYSKFGTTFFNLTFMGAPNEAQLTFFTALSSSLVLTPISPVPEPFMIYLLISGLAILSLVNKRRV